MKLEALAEEAAAAAAAATEATALPLSHAETY